MAFRFYSRGNNGKTNRMRGGLFRALRTAVKADRKRKGSVFFAFGYKR